jgi:2-polyprenyl-3-methyl-5-hydroxy-6-metoxy-1,4-benzoquinol methylase
VDFEILDMVKLESKNWTCRFCGEPIESTFADLGVQPLCETYLSPDQLTKKESVYQLHVFFCNKCFLVQLEESITPQEMYKKYAYFSSSSKGWLKHCEAYADMITKKISLNSNSQVIEVGSNDGYLLQYFAQKNIPVQGIEPAKNVAKEALKKGIPTIVRFFDKKTVNDLINQNMQGDLVIANNMIAQVPDVHGFLEGLKTLLKPSGIITVEFHYLKNLIDKNQFDTISHERFSYFSFFIIEKFFSAHGLTIFDAEEIPTHGGSLRIYARHSENQQIPKTNHPQEIKAVEKAEGFEEVDKYFSYCKKVEQTKNDLLNTLTKVKSNGKSVIGYGAHAEAHTLLNYCGIGTDLLDYLADRNPNKQRKFLAGVHLPIFSPEKIQETKPDYVLILPWSIKTELMSQLSKISNWGGRFIVPIPKLEIYDAQSNNITKMVSKEEVV